MTQPHYQDATVTLYAGDCLDVLRELPDASVDAVVTDPPYGLEFMGKEWDSFKATETVKRSGWAHDATGAKIGGNTGISAAGQVSFHKRRSTARCTGCDKRDAFRNEHKCVDGAMWEHEWTDPAPVQMLAFGAWCEAWSAECLRVLKPGGHMLAFGGTRTWHRLAVAVEDAGFELRDSIAWLYGSGFPKSLDVSKAIDKAAGAERDIPRSLSALGEGYDPKGTLTGRASATQWCESCKKSRGSQPANCQCDTTGAPATDAARQWQGWGTALKPAFEPVVVARKPLTGGTVAANVLAHGTGALNIDGCRIGDEELSAHGGGPAGDHRIYNGDSRGQGIPPQERGSNPRVGRWPANVVLDESQADALDEQSGTLTSGANPTRRGADGDRTAYGDFAGQADANPQRGVDVGGASRFFYVAKADASERVRLPKAGGGTGSIANQRCAICGKPRISGTRCECPEPQWIKDSETTHVAHPTVKPLALMRWLVRLVTPPGGTVLEPFAGSGTTVEACILEGFSCVAIEREADYLPLILQRVNRRRDPVAAVRATEVDGGLFDLFDEEPPA